MYELGDGFYTDEELNSMRQELLTGPKWYDDSKCRVAVLKLHSKKGFTGKVIVLATLNVGDSCKAISTLWKDAGIVATVSTVSSVVTPDIYKALLTVLRESRYETKFPELPGADKVFNYSDWIDRLVENV